MVHTYTVRDSRRCMRYLDFLGQRNRLAFVGDSRVRQLYAAFVTQFGETVPPAEGEARHKDLEYEDAQLGLHVQFLWRPMVDEMLWSGATRHPPEGLPKLLVIGGATHAIKTFNGSAAALAAYERNVTRLGVVLDQLAAAGMRVLWAIQEPVFYDRLAERRRAITNLQVSRWSLLTNLRAGHHQVWSEATDQIHISGPLQIQLLYSSGTTSGIRQPSFSQRYGQKPQIRSTSQVPYRYSSFTAATLPAA